MKKMFIAVAVILTVGLMASCKKGEGCYKLTYTVEVLGTSNTIEQYVYGDGEDIDKAISDVKNLYKDVKITQTKVNKNANDCAAANLNK